MKRIGQKGMALLTVMLMLVVMTIVGVGMYKLVENSIGVSAGFHRRSTTRSVAAGQAGMIMETISASIEKGTATPVAGLTVPGDAASLYADMIGESGNDNATDTPDNDPDFTMVLGSTTVNADIDFLQSIPIAGGASEFASAYDGVGQGQTLGSSFLTSNLVRIVSIDRNGGRTEVRFVAEQ